MNASGGGPQTETQPQSRAQPRSEGQPGPVYDTAVRALIEKDPATACRLLGIPLTHPPQPLTTTFPRTSYSADLLLHTGADQLAHVEYMRTTTQELVARMLIYRGLIMRAHPSRHLSQHVIVLGEGRVRGYDQPTQLGFSLRLNVLYVRDLDPAIFLETPQLAPFAPLARGGHETRTAAFAACLRLIGEKGGAWTSEFLEFAATLATITLDASTIEKVIQEVAMTVESIAEFYRDTEFGRKLRREGRAEGQAEGRQEGRAEGLSQGRAEFLAELLRDHFGDHSGVLEAADRLSWWPAQAAYRAILAATTLDDLPATPPT